MIDFLSVGPKVGADLRRFLGIIFGFAALGLPLSAQAEVTDQLSLGIGYFDLIDQKKPQETFRLEYRSDLERWVIRPWIGAELNRAGYFHGVIGSVADFNLGAGWVLTPSLGMGLYKQGNSKRLGHPLEFRSQLEVGYVLAGGSRLSVSFSHTSNASFGTSNPGVEIVTFYYTIPIFAKPKVPQNRYSKDTVDDATKEKTESSRSQSAMAPAATW